MVIKAAHKKFDSFLKFEWFHSFQLKNHFLLKSIILCTGTFEI